MLSSSIFTDEPFRGYDSSSISMSLNSLTEGLWLRGIDFCCKVEGGFSGVNWEGRQPDSDAGLVPAKFKHLKE